MSKYDRANTTGEKDAMDAYMDPYEYVYWKGKGSVLSYVIHNAGPMTPFALIWLFIDGTIIVSLLASGMMGEGAFFIIPFFALHMIPVWVWIGSMFKGVKLWKDSTYAITDKQIFIKNGATNMVVRWYKYDCIVRVKKHEGILDSLLGTVDLQFYLVNGTHIDILDVNKSEINAIFEQVKQRIEQTACVKEMQVVKPISTTSTNVSENVSNNGANTSKDYANNYNPYS